MRPHSTGCATGICCAHEHVTQSQQNRPCVALAQKKDLLKTRGAVSSPPGKSPRKPRKTSLMEEAAPLASDDESVVSFAPSASNVFPSSSRSKSPRKRSQSAPMERVCLSMLRDGAESVAQSRPNMDGS